MAERFQIPNSIPIQPPQKTQLTRTKRPVEPGKDFANVFADELQKSSLKFSAHAEKRLNMRNIRLTPQQLTSLEGAVDKLSAKGGKESLVVLGDVAFVVSVANRTIITAIDGDTIKENVFTNIDSAVVT